MAVSRSAQEPLSLVPVEGEVAENGQSQTNGSNGVAANGFDPNFTDMVIKATGPKANPRLKEVMPNLLRHLHDFCRESKITVDEWMAAVELVCLLDVMFST